MFGKPYSTLPEQAVKERRSGKYDRRNWTAGVKARVFARLDLTVTPMPLSAFLNEVETHMPNWCYNTLEISGPDVCAVVNELQINQDEEWNPQNVTEFDAILEKGIPIPEGFDQGLDPGTHADVAVVCVRAEEALSPEGLIPADWSPLGEFANYPFVKQKGIMTPEDLCLSYGFDYGETKELGRRLLENERRFGVRTIYEWKSKHWGPCWARACGVRNDGQVTDSRARVYMVTAWRPPVQLVRVLARMFPYCNFKLDFSEEQGGMDGTATITATAANANYDVLIESESERGACGTILLDGCRKSFRLHRRSMASHVHSDVVCVEHPSWTKRADYLNIKSAICFALGTVVYAGRLRDFFAEMMEEATAGLADELVEVPAPAATAPINADGEVVF